MSILCELNHHGILLVDGKDAVSFLQGYTTCDMNRLDSTNALMGGICNIQGRMVASFLAVRRGEAVMLRMARPLVAATMAFLQKYIVFSKATMADVSDEWYCYGDVEGETSLTPTVVDDGDEVRVSLRYGQERWRRERLADAAPAEAWLQTELAAGVAWVTEATSEEFLPQMMNYHVQDAVDFDKGCYLGQEIVARAQYRGALKRKLHRISGISSLDVGEELAGGTVVAASGDAALAVLANAGDDPVPVSGDVTATPL